jgi:anti-anti-sigma factor
MDPALSPLYIGYWGKPSLVAGDGKKSMVGTGAHVMTSGRLVAVKQLPEKLSVKQGRLFVREVESCLRTDRPRLVLDCSKVRQLDSAGIQVLLRCLEEAMKRNGDVKLAAVPPGAAAILELTRVDRLFETFDNTADAVNSFRQFPTEPFQQAPGHQHSTLSSTVRHNGIEDYQSDSRQGPLGSQETTRISGRWLRRQIAGCLMLLLVAPLAAAAPSPQQETVSGQQVDGASSTKPRPATSDSGADDVQAEPSQPETLPNSPGTVRSQTVDDNRLASEQQPSPKPQSGTQEPLGTAAAEFVKTTGVAASRPAGAAIAPAKQRRARSILIKVGVIAGAGVAVGAVVALSSASPSRPH